MVLVYIRQNDWRGEPTERLMVPTAKLKLLLDRAGLPTNFDDVPAYPPLLGQLGDVPRPRQFLDRIASKAVDGQVGLWVDPDPLDWCEYIVPTPPIAFGEMTMDLFYGGPIG